MASHNDQRGFHDADEVFYEALASGGGFPGVWRLLRSVKVQIDRARRPASPALGRMEQAIVEHERIRAAVAQGDATAARLAMRDHLSTLIPDVASLITRYPGFAVERQVYSLQGWLPSTT